MSGNLTKQFNSAFTHPQEKLSRACHNPMAFVVDEAINNFVRLNLDQSQEQSKNQAPGTDADADEVIGGYI